MQYPTRTVTRSTPMHWTGCRALRRPSSASASSLIQMFVSPSLPLCFLLEEARLTVLASQWVNDIVLCNYNRTLVSASSDSLVLAWSPHSTNHQDQVTPTPVGRHGDYVRCLATPREGNWVASGGFDRKIKLWDVGEGRSSSVPLRKSRPPLPFELVLMFLSCSRAAKPASVNLLARNERLRIPHRGGHSRARRSYLGSSVVQAGLSTGWSHGQHPSGARLGGRQLGTLFPPLLRSSFIFYSILIGLLCLAQLLSASSDSTVKLWSIKAQKPLHTFSHHASAVWSLFSQHPSFEMFYSGDRAGNVCKIDLTGTGDPSEGECILLARDGPEDGESKSGQEGITQLVGQDDAFLYTAAGGSSVLRWKDVPTKARRAGALLRRAKESSEGVLADEPLAASPPSQTPPSEFDSAFPSSSERERPSAHSVSFLEGLTAPLGRSSSSPTPRSPANAPHLAPHGRPSSLRTPRQSLVSPVRPPLEHLNSQNPTTLLDIPYDSLIPLTAPEDEYFAPAFQRSNRDPDAATIYSTISNTSARHRPPLVGASSSSFRRVAHSIIDVGPEAIAQRDYYDRESAAEATPLRAVPDDVIEGGYGLRRVELLNDRRHALTEDTEGEVGLWDIVRGRCIGVFAPDELSDAIAERRPSIANSVTSSGSSGSFSGDLLEYVRERIEGEVSVAVWCKCDTRVGSLTVHLEPARVFDAEAYIDEVGLVGPLEEYPADHRISLGKWALRQLFDGFVEAEMSLRVPDSRPPPPPPSALFGTAPVSDELFSLTAPQPRAKPARTLGMTISLATPAVKKAVLPSLPPSSPRFGNSELQTIPQSPMLTGPLTPRAGGNTPTMERQEGDYFSSRSPSIEQANSVPLLSPSAAPTPLPGGSGTLMGRLKFLGKGTKKPNSMADTPAAATPVAPLEITDVGCPSLFLSVNSSLTPLLPAGTFHRGATATTHPRHRLLPAPHALPSHRSSAYRLRPEHGRHHLGGERRRMLDRQVSRSRRNELRGYERSRAEGALLAPRLPPRQPHLCQGAAESRTFPLSLSLFLDLLC